MHLHTDICKYTYVCIYIYVYTYTYTYTYTIYPRCFDHFFLLVRIWIRMLQSSWSIGAESIQSSKSRCYGLPMIHPYVKPSTPNFGMWLAALRRLVATIADCNVLRQFVAAKLNHGRMQEDAEAINPRKEGTKRDPVFLHQSLRYIRKG